MNKLFLTFIVLVFMIATVNGQETPIGNLDATVKKFLDYVKRFN